MIVRGDRSGLARALRVAVPAIATFLILGLVVRRAGLARLLAAFRDADPAWLAVAFVWNAALHAAVPAEKVRRILARLGHRLSFAEAVRIWLGCQPLRFVLPLKSGEVFKVVYLRTVHRVPPGVGAWAVVLDKLTNVVALGAFAAAGLVAGRARVPHPILLGFLVGAVPLLAVVLVALLAAPIERESGRVPGAVGVFVREAVSAVRAVGTVATLVLLVVATCQVVAEAISFTLCLRAVGANVPLAVMLTGAPLVILLSNVPITLSGLGTRELALMTVLADRAAPVTLAAAGMLVSFFGPVLLVLFGIPFVTRFLAGIYRGSVPDPRPAE